MSRGSDPFWSYVEEMADGSLKCVFCKRIYPKTTSHLRIKHHLAGVKGGGTTLCEKVTPDAQRAMLDQLPNRMHVSMPSSEMQGQPLLDVDLSTWVDSLILPMPDALETGLETEPADQPFEMDMNNIPSSLMRDVEFSRGKEKMTWELMPSVAERGSSSKRPVDRSVPSSSNNEATNAASTPFRGLAIEQEEQPCLDEATPDVQRAAFDQLPNRMHVSMPSSEMQGQPLLDDELLWLNSLMEQEIFLTDENVAPGMPMRDAPETGLGTEPADQPFDNISSSLMRELMQSVAEGPNAASTPVRGLAIEQEEQPRLDDGRGGMDIFTSVEAEFVEEPGAPVVLMTDEPETRQRTEQAHQSVAERGSSSKRPVDRSVPSSSNNEATNAASTPVRGLAIEQPRLIGGETGLVEEPRAPVVLMTNEPRTEQAHQSSMMDTFFRMCRKIMSREYKHSVVERGSSSKRPVDRSVPSSSNNEATNSASTPVRGLAIEQPRLDDGLGGMETELVEEPRAPVVQRTEQAHQSLVDDVLRMCRNIMSQEYKYSVVERGSSSESPAHKRRRTRRYFLPTTKLEGQAFERNMKDVWSWLLNDEVSSIGIYGMGGVGKTAFATHIHNQLRHVCQERQDIFHHVCWITVSQDFSIEALQDCIANYFDLDLRDQKDAVVRAGKLWTELTAKKKYVLILDGLWDNFPLEEVGIPLRTDGCKLVFTARSLDICKKMDCQRIIKVEPLSEGEAWNLFVEKLGHGVGLFPETKQIVAKSIVMECAGLPLGIVTMAGSMKGVEPEYRWRDALQRLRISEVGPRDMKTKVLRVLEVSYDQLNDPELQKCFLHITLFPKGKNIRREDLIEFLIDAGISKRQEQCDWRHTMWGRHEKFDRGHTMLDQLENASLLEGSRDDENYRYVKMHDLIWDMARKILNESHGGRVQAGAQLTELPDETWWRENLLIVSLMENRIKDIPSGFSPRCPNLSTLLLCRNYKLNLVESSFFQHFIRLQVLDLSDTDIEKLPDSICHLTRLTVLLLGWCAKLIYVPSLAKLKALEKLDLSYTGLENLPEGMERLKDLRYLNLDGSGVRVLPPGILPELSKLQFLKLHQKFGVFLPVRGHEVVRLWKLKTLECNFHDLENFGIFHSTFHLAGVLPQIACKVTVGRPSFSLLEDLNYTKSKSEAWFYDLMIDDASFLSRISFPKLVIVNCQNIRSLCSWGGYGRLEILHLDGLMFLETLFEAPSYELTFSTRIADALKEIVIHKCHRMKVLFPPRLLSGLQLEVIVVEDCHNMGVIMGTDEEDRTHHIVTSENLKVLVLKKLPELSSIYCGRLECKSIEEITVNDCPQLTRIPLTIPHSLKKIQVDPASLRNTIQWGYHF